MSYELLREKDLLMKELEEFDAKKNKVQDMENELEWLLGEAEIIDDGAEFREDIFKRVVTRGIVDDGKVSFELSVGG